VVVAIRFVVVGLLASVLSTGASMSTAAPAPSASADSEPAATTRTSAIGSRTVAFEVANSNTTTVLCRADGQPYTLRGRLVGPRGGLDAGSVHRVNVLVHDLATGAWFWNLRKRPAYDYASQLARRGETSLVLDRLGYDRSALGNGRNTCLGAQAEMLHQVVQELYAGKYTYPGTRHPGDVPAAEHVVVHGHGVGAAIAQVEAGTFDDVDGLVLMSWADSGASSRAVDEAARQSGRCLTGAEYSPFGATAADFKQLMFHSASGPVRRRAATLRNPSPCGDALSLSPLLLAQAVTTRKIEVPVLLLFGARDVLIRRSAASRQADAYGSQVRVTTYVVPGAGSALPLEKSAPETRARVLRWLDSALG
jgi:pimeloyl-ACP methyl ester carboxylesterase